MAFSGRAIYDTDVFDGVAEDVSDLITMISPFETPLLDALTPPERPAQNVLHEWLEDELAPLTVTTSTAIASTTATSSVEVHDGSGNSVAGFLQVGDILKVNPTGEYVQVSAISGDDVSFTRQFGSTSATSVGAGEDIFVVASAALEGADVSEDTSRPRTRLSNYTQIIKKDIIVSGTIQAVNHIGLSDEMAYQREKKTREALRDLEKAVILGKSSGNTLGSSSAYRSMKGLLDAVSTNVTSTGTLTPNIVNDIVKDAWEAGGDDLDILVVSNDWKQLIDQFNDSRVQVVNRDEGFHQRVSVFDSTYGSLRMVMNRYMPTSSLMVLSSRRVHVVPLQGRSFRFERVSKTGDSEKGMILGEYTLEYRNEKGLCQANNG